MPSALAVSIAEAGMRVNMRCRAIADRPVDAGTFAR